MIDRIPPTRARSWRALLALALGLTCLGVVGCESSNDEDEIVPPPIAIRSTNPGFAVDAGADLQTIEIVFTRAPASAAVVSSIFPPPLTPGEFLATRPGSRQWNWLGLQLDTSAGGCHMLVDGVEFAQPYVLSFGVDPTRNYETGLAGRVDTQSFAVADPVQAVVFALRFDTVFNPSQPSSWAQAWEAGDIRSMTSLVDDNASVDEALDYRVPYLEEGIRFYLVVIADTDGDLVYDPSRDWWDISRNEGIFAAFQAQPFGGDKGEPEVSVNMRLRPPVAPPSAVNPR